MRLDRGGDAVGRRRRRCGQFRWKRVELCSGRDQSTARSEEHTSELQSLMRISYAVFCLKKKKKITNRNRIGQESQQEQNRQHNSTHNETTQGNSVKITR